MAKAQNIYPRGVPAHLCHPLCILGFAAVDHAEGAAGGASIVTYDADTTGKTFINRIHCSFDAAPAAGTNVKIEDVAGNVVWKQYLTTAGPFAFAFDQPKGNAAPNSALIVTLSAPGGAIHGSLDVTAWREQ